MWLLDVNMPKALATLLGEFGQPAETAGDRGWGELTNGTLVDAAPRAGFRPILTRDRLL